MDDTNAGLPAISSNSPDGNLRQRSGRVVACRSTAIDRLLPPGCDPRLKVFVMLFKAILEETCNPDIIELSIGRACKLLEGEMDKSEVESICKELIRAARRRPNPMDDLFR